MNRDRSAKNHFRDVKNQKPVVFCSGHSVTVTGNDLWNEAEHLMKYTLGKAALATGKSKTTLHRAITSGKLSATRNADGEYEIDPAELMRIYEIVTPEPQKRSEMERSGTVDETPVLRAEIEGLKQQLALVKDERDDLRRRLDEDSAERRRLALLLTEPPGRPTPKPPLWKRLFGG
jgi:hypothetical protein